MATLDVPNNQTIKIPTLRILSNRDKPHLLPKWSSSGALLASSSTTTPQAPTTKALGQSSEVAVPKFKLSAADIEAVTPAPSKPGRLVKQPTSDGIMNANWRTRQPINALVESGKRQKFSSTSSASGRSSGYNSPRSNSSVSSISSIGSSSSGFSGRQSLSDLKRGLNRSIDPTDEARRHLSMRSHLPPLPYDTFLAVDEFEDDLLSYTTEDIIGEGGQGKIVAGTVRNQRVAIKISEDDVILAEYHTATRFSHPNVLKPVGFSCIKVDPGSARSVDSDRSWYSPRSAASTAGVWVYMAAYEICDNGDLASYLHKNKHIQRDIQQMTRIFDQILAGLEHIHSRGFLHTDIKPENILVTESLEVKVGDFGMCQAFSSRMIAQGTPSFMSPEIVYSWFTPKNPHRFSAAADVFSFACLIVYALTDRYPFNRITARLKRGIQIPWDALKQFYAVPTLKLEELAFVSPELSVIVRQCLVLNEQDRPSIGFIRSYIHSKILNQKPLGFAASSSGSKQ